MVSKVHVANRRLPPPSAAELDRGPPSDSWRWGPRAGPQRGGLGSPREFPFPLEQRKVCLRGICHSRAGQDCGARGAGDAEKVCVRRDPGARRGAVDPSAGAVRVPGAGGAANMESGRRAGGGGGAEVGAQPPLFPSPSGPSSEHKAERARSGGPAPQESACAEYRGRGWEPNFFLPQNGHVSFFFLAEFPRARWRDCRGAVAAS